MAASEPDGELLQPAQDEVLLPARFDGLVEAHGREALDHRAERRGRLDPRERSAEAEVDAVAERYMLHVIARHIELFGVAECGGIAVGGAEEQGDLLALSERVAIELDVLVRDHARGGLHGAVVTQQLLDRVR